MVYGLDKTFLTFFVTLCKINWGRSPVESQLCYHSGCPQSFVEKGYGRGNHRPLWAAGSSQPAVREGSLVNIWLYASKDDIRLGIVIRVFVLNFGWMMLPSHWDETSEGFSPLGNGVWGYGLFWDIEYDLLQLQGLMGISWNKLIFVKMKMSSEWRAFLGFSLSCGGEKEIYHSGADSSSWVIFAVKF